MQTAAQLDCGDDDEEEAVEQLLVLRLTVTDDESLAVDVAVDVDELIMRIVAFEQICAA